MTKIKRHKYTSGLILEDGKGSSVGEFNPPDTDGAEWTLVKVRYILLPSGSVRWVAQWHRTVIILDTPRGPEDPSP